MGRPRPLAQALARHRRGRRQGPWLPLWAPLPAEEAQEVPPPPEPAPEPEAEPEPERAQEFTDAEAPGGKGLPRHSRPKNLA